MRYLFNLLVALDQLVNALCNGAPDETISARCWRLLSINLWGIPRMSLATDRLFDLAEAKGIKVQLNEPVRKKGGSVIIEYKDGTATSIGFKPQSERAGAIRSGIVILENL